MNLGKVIFCALTILSLVLALLQGLPPIRILETVFWASLAVLWAAKDWKTVWLNYTLLAVAAIVLLGEGYLVGIAVGRQQSFKGAVSRRPSPNSAKNPIDDLLNQYDEMEKVCGHKVKTVEGGCGEENRAY